MGRRKNKVKKEMTTSKQNRPSALDVGLPRGLALDVLPYGRWPPPFPPMKGNLLRAVLDLPEKEKNAILILVDNTREEMQEIRSVISNLNEMNSKILKLVDGLSNAVNGLQQVANPELQSKIDKLLPYVPPLRELSKAINKQLQQMKREDEAKRKFIKNLDEKRN